VYGWAETNFVLSAYSRLDEWWQGWIAVLFRDLIDAVRRQWIVVMLALLVAGMLGYLALPKVSYRASTILIVYPPKIAQVLNRLKDVRPSIAATSAVLAAQLKTPTAEAELRRSGLVGDYDLVPRNSGSNQLPKYRIPTLQLVVTTGRQDQALRSLDLLNRAFTAAMNELQASWNVAPDRYMTVAVLSSPSVDRLTGSKSRVAGATVLVGVGYAIALAMWADRRGLRIRIRRRGGRPPARMRRDPVPVG
jgi:hypothetical protein